MSLRELFGLIMLIIAAILFPFGYWLHRGWYLAALLLAAIGCALFPTGRISRRASRVAEAPDHLNPPLIPNHLRGFPGAKISSGTEIDLDIDVDGE